MRKIVSFHVVTADGYDQGPNREFDWPVVDDEFNDFAVEQIDRDCTLMFGRLTYEVMASYWPTPAAEEDDARITSLMNRLPKIVVSRTLHHADWAGTTVVSDLDKFAAIKPEAGGEIIIMGSSNLTVNLIEAGLLDEARIMIHPIVLGAGRSLFCTARRRIGLELLSTRTFASGSVLLTYRPS